MLSNQVFHVAANAASAASQHVGLLGIISLGLGIASIAIGIIFGYQQNRRLKQQLEELANLSEQMASTLGLTKEAVIAPGLFDQLRTIANNYGAVTSRSSVFIEKFLRAELNQASEYTKTATSDEVEIRPRELAQVARQLINLAEDEDVITTTSYVSTKDFWTQPDARRYLEDNRDLIKSKAVSVTRIFLFDNDAAMEESEDEMRKQTDAKIHVRTAFTAAIEPDLQRDMFLLGTRLAAENVMAAGRKDILSVRVFDADSEEIDKIRKRLNLLLRSSTPWPEVEADRHE